MNSQSSSKPSDTSSNILQMCCSDISNSGSFIDSLVTFLNEASICMQEVKNRAGIQAGCISPVQMNDEEKKEKLCSILAMLNYKCQQETNKNEIPSHPNEQVSIRYANPGGLQSSSSRQISRIIRKGGGPLRPGNSSARAAVPTPDHIFLPATESTMNTFRPYGSDSYPCPTYSRLPAKPRTAPGHSSTFDSSQLGSSSYRSSSGPGVFDELSSSPARGSSGGYTSTPAGIKTCLQDCPISLHSHRKQDCNRLQGQDIWSFRNSS
ncbi:hypothetical protein ABEB36_001303 [Hypothenemus hampei]|uniref:Uncharacterized protein n=1 Tax=Hypothenemus hampei TaxID=57062 RepID=A0ABD1FFZ2_HYPHA